MKACGWLLFSFTNSIELGEAEGEPANRVRTFLDEVGAHWFPGGPVYVWHCHILEHEDYEVMRPYVVQP